MKRRSTLSTIMWLLVIALAGFSCPNHALSQANAGWITLFDGSSLDNWNPIGNANWKLMDGIVQADMGNGFLVSKNSYTDFQVLAEFWVDEDANSGVFVRCSDPQKVSPANSYEINIYDKNQEYTTGAVTDIAKPASETLRGWLLVMQISLILLMVENAILNQRLVEADVALARLVRQAVRLGVLQGSYDEPVPLRLERCW